MKKITKSLLVVVSIFLIAGCGKVAKLENGQDAVAKLKGKDISVDALYTEMKEKYALNVLLDMIDEEILNKEYKTSKDIKQSVQAQIDSWTTQFGSEQELLNQAQNAWGIRSMSELKDYLTLQYKRNYAVEDYAKSLVSEDDIKDYYDEKIFGDISARHILIKANVNDDMTDAEKTAAEEEALKKAKDIIKKLDKGEKFADLAKENSDDEGTKENGGKLNDFTNGQMVSEFEKAAVELEVGKYTKEPVKTEYGYHIILKEGQKDKPKLKVVKDDIIEKLANEKTNSDSKISEKALISLRKEYKVKIEDETLKKQYETYVNNVNKSN